jgi:hypothetical protein
MPEGVSRARPGWFIAAACALAAVSLAGAERAQASHCLIGLLCSHPNGDPALTAPDPGGDESATVPVPPQGKTFGFNDESWEAAWQDLPAADAAARAKEAGANAFRFTVSWAFAEPARDEWNEATWRRARHMYDALLARGMTPIIIVGYSPWWARAGVARLCRSARGCEYPPDRSAYPEWREYVSEVAQRFPAAVIEVWNEPNESAFWKGGPNPQRYSELVAEARRAIDAVDPGITLLGGSVSNRISAGNGDMTMRSFLARAYSASPSLGASIDALSIHLYGQMTSFGANTLFARSFDDVRTVLGNHGDAGRRIWVTETGLTTSGGRAVSDAVQADGLLREYRRLMTMPDVETMIIHSLYTQVDRDRTSPAYGFGVARSAQPFVPKPAYCAFAGRVGTPTPAAGCPPIAE